MKILQDFPRWYMVTELGNYFYWPGGINQTLSFSNKSKDLWESRGAVLVLDKEVESTVREMWSKLRAS